MAEIVNLNQFRKKRDKQQAEKRAAENRRTHGLSKDERAKMQREQERAKKDLDDKRID